MLKTVLSLILSVLTQYLLTRRRDDVASAKTQALGRAEAERDAAMHAAERAEAMGAVPAVDDEALMRRLEDGTA